MPARTGLNARGHGRRKKGSKKRKMKNKARKQT
jgi:hypothetical protein